MRCLVLAVLAGCYAPSPYTSCLVGCVANADCPTGQACFAGRCSERSGQCTIDGGVDADPDGDDDGDGIINSIDKCPTLKSTDNNDHDGDGLGDPCDPCPHLSAAAANADTDGDGVGNGCDNRPLLAGEKWLAFHGFYSDTEVETWAHQGNFAVTNGKLVASNASLGGGYIERPVSPAVNVHLSTAFQITATTADTALEAYAGVSTRRDASGFFHACLLVRSMVDENLVHRIYNAAPSDQSTAFVGVFAAMHRLDMVQTASTVCRIGQNSVTRTGIVGAGGNIGLEASFVTVEFDYLFIVGLP